MSDRNVTMFDSETGVTVMNDSGVDTASVYEALRGGEPEVASLIRWVTTTKGDSGMQRQGGIFERDRYVTPNRIFDQFSTAQDAAINDDIVSSWLESTEALAFGLMNFSAEEEDEEDIWNQVAFDIDLPSRIREMWRELATVSQFSAVTWWGRKNYKVRGKSEKGVARKKSYDQLVVPLGITLLDPLKVVPVGNLMFNQEQLCMPADTRVWTANGPVRMEDVEVGELVWSWDGKGLTQSPVIRKVPTGTKPIVRIRTLNHDLRVSPDHPVLCLDGTHGAVGQVWKRAAEIGKGDVLVGMQRFNEDLQVGEAPSSDEAFILGLVIGDGGYNKRIGVSAPSSDERFWTFVQKSEQSDCWLWTGMRHVRGYGLFRARRQVLAHRYAWVMRQGGDPNGRLQNVCGTNHCVNPDHWNDSKAWGCTQPVERYAGRMNTQFNLWPACDQTDEWVQKITSTLGCEPKVWNYGTGCDQIRFLHQGLAHWATFQRDVCTLKRAPAWLWSASYDVRLAFLRGFLIADGHNPPTRPNEWSWGLGNHALSEDMRMLAVSVGWTARSVVPAVHSKGITWNSTALETTTRNQIPNSFRRNRSLDLDDTLLARTVVAVAAEPEEPMWDIEVEGSHTFVAEGLVVHNCYIADRTEVDLLDAAVLNDPQADAVSRQIIVAKYAPPDYERRNLAKQGINADWLYVLNPANCWRHTVTRPQYQRFAEVRMKSIFELLDLKHQLRQMDRAHLIGATNFIVLIRKGTDHLPGKQTEIDALKAQVSSVARVPILVGDHRLSVEIVTPKNDFTLSPEKYGTIDSRITSRLYQMFLIHGGSGSVRSDDSVKLAKIIARGMESRRTMLRYTLERQIVGPAVAANDSLISTPKLRFHPTRIELDFDMALVQFLMDLRDRGDLSRDTVLNELDFDQEDEAVQRKREAREYDDVFVPTNVPFSGPGPAHEVPVGPGGKPNELPGGSTPPTTPVAPHSHGPDGVPVALPPNSKPAPATPKINPKAAGRAGGGNRNGGGAAPGSGQGLAPRRGRPKN